MISAVGMMMMKVAAETSSEGVMAGPLAEVGVVEVNPCVITFNESPPPPPCFNWPMFRYTTTIAKRFPWAAV